MKKSVITLAAVAALALPTAASADTIASGTTAFQLAQGFKGQLRGNGVRMSPKTLTIGIGQLDPVTGTASLEYKGKLTFRHGHKKVAFKGLAAKLGAGGKLTGRAAGKGKKVTIAKLSGGTVTRNGFAADVSGIAAKLTKSAAKKVNDALGLGSLHKGVLGTATLSEQPSAVSIKAEGDVTLVASDDAAMQFLFASGGIVSASAIPPATQEGLTTFHLPIAGGTAAPDLKNGDTQLAGGIKQEQSMSGKSIDLSNFLLQWEPPTFLRADSTQFGTNGVASLDSSAATISSDPNARTITFDGIQVRLNAVAAFLTNQTFGTTFKEGDSLGALSGTLTGT